MQWPYFGYLAAIKTQNGAAMSFGRISTFLDIYIERDLEAGKITETDAQELIDNMVMKFRIVRFPAYQGLRPDLLRRPRTGRPGTTPASAMTAVPWSPRPPSVCSTP